MTVFMLAAGTLMWAISLPALVWWVRGYREPSGSDIGSDQYWASPLMVYPLAGFFGGLCVVGISLWKLVN